MFPSITVLGHAFELSGFAKIASLLVLPFAHEDLAIVLGGYIVVNDLMPVSLVALSIYGGMVASDFALYGIGAAARRLPWLSRYAVDERVVRFGDTLKRNIFGLVALCRVVPGVVFVAFVACGWTRVSLARFTAASLIVSAFYLPLMLYLVITFGDALDEHLGVWAWPLLLAAITASNFVRKRVFAFAENEADSGEAALPLPQASFGMPALARADRKVAPAERIPPALFYVPLVLYWIWLGLRHRSLTLPSAANPSIFTGGMWGETKSSYFDELAADARPWIADFVLVDGRPARRASLPRSRTRARRAPRSRARLSADRQARYRLAWARRSSHRYARRACGLSRAFSGKRRADAAALRAACRRRPPCSMRGCRARRRAVCCR